MGAISDLSVEVLARIFEELDLDDAWTAREVCRYWYSVFAYVAYDSANSVSNSLSTTAIRSKYCIDLFISNYQHRSFLNMYPSMKHSDRPLPQASNNSFLFSNLQIERSDILPVNIST